MQARPTPEDFLCPISQEIMEEPVIAADGYTYEKENILKWMQTQENRVINSPMTGEPLEHSMLTPNRVLKSLIKDFLEKQQQTQANRSNDVVVQENETWNPNLPFPERELVNQMTQQTWWKKQQELWDETKQNRNTPVRFTEIMRKETRNQLFKVFSHGKAWTTKGLVLFTIGVAAIASYMTIEMVLILATTMGKRNLKLATYLFGILGALILFGPGCMLLVHLIKLRQPESEERRGLIKRTYQLKSPTVSQIRNALVDGFSINEPVMRDFFMAAIADEVVDIIELLLYRELNVHFEYRESVSLPSDKSFLSGLTPLNAAQKKGNLAIIERLLLGGALANESLVDDAVIKKYSPILDVLSESSPSWCEKIFSSALKYNDAGLAKYLIEERNVKPNSIQLSDLIKIADTELVKLALINTEIKPSGEDILTAIETGEPDIVCMIVGSLESTLPQDAISRALRKNDMPIEKKKLILEILLTQAPITISDSDRDFPWDNGLDDIGKLFEAFTNKPIYVSFQLRTKFGLAIDNHYQALLSYLYPENNVDTDQERFLDVIKTSNNEMVELALDNRPINTDDEHLYAALDTENPDLIKKVVISRRRRLPVDAIYQAFFNENGTESKEQIIKILLTQEPSLTDFDRLLVSNDGSARINELIDRYTNNPGLVSEQLRRELHIQRYRNELDTESERSSGSLFFFEEPNQSEVRIIDEGDAINRSLR